MPAARQPFDHLRAVGVSAQAMEARDPCAHVEFRAVDAHAARRALRKRLRHRAGQDISGEHHVATIMAKRVLQVVEHGTGIAEAAAGKHDARALAAGDLERVLARPQAVQRVEVEGRMTARDHLARLRREERGVLHAEFAGPDRHRAVEVDRNVVKQALARQARQVMHQDLPATDAEGGHDRRATTVPAVLDDPPHLGIDIGGRRAGRTRTGRGFHDHHVGFRGVSARCQVGLASWPDIA